MAHSATRETKARELRAGDSETAETAKLKRDIQQLYAILHQREASNFKIHFINDGLVIAYVFSIRGVRNPTVEAQGHTDLDALRELKAKLRHQATRQMSLLLQVLDETER